jgi:hypothetical protein
VGGLAFAGAGLREGEPPVRSQEQSAARTASLRAAAGQGVAFGLLGGFRTIVADCVWLRAYASWERSDAPATATLLRLTTALDPRPLGFWLNGARIMAYDIPVWRIAALGGDSVPGAVRRHIGEEQARRALDYLDAAMMHHPASAALWIERAAIELNRLHDLAAAAKSYRRAAAQPDTPYYAARLHAELLRRLGRKAEALAWLKQLHPHLPPHDRAAQAGRVLARIRMLERELRVPAAQAYRPVTRPAKE